MTDKEFKRLSRAPLIDIIYQLQLQVDTLTKEKEELQKALDDKRLRINQAGNIADAALEISDCFRCAQNAADLYLNEIKILSADAEKQRQKFLADARAEAEAERKKIIANAHAEAAAIIANAKKPRRDLESAIEVILREYQQNEPDNR